MPTLQVVEGVSGSGLRRRRLSRWPPGNGFEVGAVALQNGRHETQEGLLDLHLQRRLLLVPGEICLNGSHVHC